MPGIQFAAAREWIAYAEVAAAAPTPLQVGDTAVMVAGPVDDVAGGFVVALDYIVTPAMNGHVFQPGSAKISGLVLSEQVYGGGDILGTVTIKLLTPSGHDLFNGAVLTRPNVPANYRVDLDLDLTGEDPIAEGTALRLECTAFGYGATALKGLTVMVSGAVVT